ncbi:MAG: phosphoribosylglycinamide formyltransferase [Bacteroidetes bacterium]|nr:phosphoribosylglycinamide formyltransferase [Bacteroidota bacterium]
MTTANVSHIAIFASGTGSNAANIIHYFSHQTKIKIALIVCNNPTAGVIKIAKDNNVPYLIIEKEKFFKGDAYIEELKNADINFIVLAGFLWKIPKTLINHFPDKIINIHPALLPKYGGKGMYGHFVHNAVIAANETESGITIHFVDDIYDNGKIIFQAKCPVNKNDTAETLAKKIHDLEYKNFPKLIEDIIEKKYS